MEVMANQWNEAENEVEEVGLQRKRGLQRSNTSSSSSSSNKDIEVEGGGLEFDESKIKEKFDIFTVRNAEMILRHEDTENSTILPASDPPLPDESTLENVTYEIGTVSMVKGNDRERQELYLESVLQKPPTHGFYCPNCNTCIQNVYIQKIHIEREQINATTQPVQQSEQIRCSSCFSFLIPIGSWLFPGLVSDHEGGESNDQDNIRQLQGSTQEVKITSQYETSELEQSEELVNQSVARGTITITDEKGKQSLQRTEELILPGPEPQTVANELDDKINGTGHGSISGDNMKSEDSSNLSSRTSQDQGKGQVPPTKKYFWSDWAVIGKGSEVPIPKIPEIGPSKRSDWSVITATYQTTILNEPEIFIPDKKQTEQVVVQIDEVNTEPTEQVEAPTESTPLLAHREPPVPASSKKLEILKSIVYGGLNESLASLSVVTSAASADAATLNIVALAIANLIGGLFVLGHNLRELLKVEQPRRAEDSTEEPVDQYNELLGQRENFYLHALIAILSFIIFGLVPPVVYGFTFRERDDKDFKLAAVAGASLLCIILLSIAKAYIKRPNNYLTYFQTVLYYVSTGAVASVLSYLAGDLVKKLVEKLGWFDSSSKLALQIPGISIQPSWG